MAVVQTTQFKVAPGKAQEVRAFLGEAKAFFEEAGFSVRILFLGVAGPASGNLVLVIEAADEAAFSAGTQKVMANQPGPLAKLGMMADPPLQVVNVARAFDLPA